MFTRRPFGPRGRGFGPRPHPMLARANELMAIEDFPGAARAYEELALAARGRNGPAAPFLYMQSGHARILAGQPAVGVVDIRQALDLFASHQEWIRFLRNKERAVTWLNQFGFNRESTDVAAYLSDQVPGELGTGKAPAIPFRKVKGQLPVRCAGCGAPLRSDEVEWVDDCSAECQYCGSIARVE